MTNQTLFQDQRPDILFLQEIYDPDDPENSGIVVPTVGSLICHAPGSSIYYSVTAVHEITHKCILTPLRVMASIDDGSITSVIDYTNSKFFVFYDDRVNPVKLNIDSLLVIFGMDNVEYLLKRKHLISGVFETVSYYYDSDGNFNGNKVPLKPYGVNGAKYCSNCHTPLTLVDNDNLILEIYDSAGTMSASVSMFAKRAAILNDLDIEPVIIDFQLNSPQTSGELLYLYERQDVSQLMIEPTLVYSNGYTAIVPVDNQRCYLYGIEDLITSHPGLRQTVMCKYFLALSQQATNVLDDRHGRYVTVEKDIVIWSRDTLFSSKVSAIPIWNANTGMYNLRFYLYTTDRNTVHDITDRTTILTTFVGNDYNTEQLVTVSVDLQDLFSLDASTVHVQNIWIRLKPYGTLERYIIKDSTNDALAYGVESALFRRPVIRYDSTLTQYFIPSSVFANTGAFIDAFYTKARPLFNPSIEPNAPVPTHFTIRDAYTKNTILPAPVPIAQYNQAFNLVSINGVGAYLNKTVVVEFLIHTTTYAIVYGVPVDVHSGTYNT